jgi:hypothetical protein
MQTKEPERIVGRMPNPNKDLGFLKDPEKRTIVSDHEEVENNLNDLITEFTKYDSKS